MLPYVCFLRWVKFCSGGFIQVFFIWRLKKLSLVKLDRWSSYRVTAVWKFAWADSALVVLDELSSYRGGCLNSLECSIKCYWSKKIHFSLCVFLVTNFHNGISKLIFLVVLFSLYILYNIYWNKDRHISYRPSIFRLLDLFGIRRPPLRPRPPALLFC